MKTFSLAAAIALAAVSGAAMAQAPAYSASARYETPDDDALQAANRRVCKDAQVTLALEKVFGGADPIHCDKAIYGSPATFNDLVHAVGAYKADLDRNAVAFYPGYIGVLPRIIVAQNGKAVASMAPSALDLMIVSGENLVVAGGGNQVLAGGARAANVAGGRIVPAGNAAVTGVTLSSLPSARFGADAAPGATGKAVKLGAKTLAW